MTKNHPLRSALLSLLSAIFMSSLLTMMCYPLAAVATSTPDYYHCVGKVGGEFDYGRAPMACNASSFGDDRFVLSQFPQFIFQDGSSRLAERQRYAQEMNGFIRDAAAYYIKKRKPSVSASELSGWMTAVQMVASHESYWTHYRKASDAKLKMMRGDSGHGHGFMQIDDRAHFPAITNGTAWNIIGNITYGLDILYPFWVKAATASCVRGEADYIARTRSAWAAYNSGNSAKLCRWTNPNDFYSDWDRAFNEHVQGRYYEKYVADKTKPSSLNVACLIEKQENCPSRGPTAPPALEAGVLYQTEDGRSCVINAQKAYCVDQVRDAICLNSISGVTGKSAVSVSSAQISQYSPILADRHLLCRAYDSTLLEVGSNLETMQAMNLRATPGGGFLTAVPARVSLEILDFEMRNAPSNERYYKVRYAGHTGYIFAGTSLDADAWAVASEDSVSSTLAKPGSRIRILNDGGINLRATVGGAILLTVPYRATVTVSAVAVQGTENGVYYKITYAGKTGYIYSGMLTPVRTVEEWTEIL